MKNIRDIMINPSYTFLLGAWLAGIATALLHPPWWGPLIVWPSVWGLGYLGIYAYKRQFKRGR